MKGVTGAQNYHSDGNLDSSVLSIGKTNYVVGGVLRRTSIKTETIENSDVEDLDAYSEEN